MTDEADFHRALDQAPDDHSLRLVFADWLEEQGDERADGYRALGLLQKRPVDYYGGIEWTWWWKYPDVTDQWYYLPADWWLLLIPTRSRVGRERSYNRRQEAEDDAARAFARLPAERQAELLARPVLL